MELNGVKLKLEELKKVYFIGIGGIGMSALARYLHSTGIEVSGYDRVPTALTAELIREGIGVKYSDDPSSIARDVDLVVYTPAIPAWHGELAFYRNHNVPLLKRAELLGLITTSRPTIAVAGTHGKTTVSTMIAHLLKGTGIDCTAFLGGIALNYKTNYLAGSFEPIVVEADEYDRSFLQLRPDIALITYMEADHLDIYGDIGSLQQAYHDFSAGIKPGGKLLFREGLPLDLPGGDLRVADYSLESRQAAYHPLNLRIEGGRHHFDLATPGGLIQGFRLGVGGRQNVENAVAALAAAIEYGAPIERLAEGLASFRGIERRFEFIERTGRFIFIDDYAHHPTELRAVIQSARELYPEKKMTVVFQPHLFSRTRDFADDFARALEGADEVYLLPIYPAREQPIPGVDSSLIFDRITGPRKKMCSSAELLELLGDRRPELLLTAGAGDIGNLVESLRRLGD